MSRILVIILIIIGANECFSCSCNEDSIRNVRAISIEYSDIIFTGKVIKKNHAEGTFTIKVLESFKGNVKGKLIASSMVDSVTFSYCAFWPSPYWGDEFIIYADYAKGTNRIYIGSCLATRSLSNPHIHLSYVFLEYNDKGIEIDEKGIERIAKSDLKEELEYLATLNRR